MTPRHRPTARRHIAALLAASSSLAPPLLAADRYMGVDTQMFGTEVDYGFSKTKAEAFQKWNHQRVLYDAVRAVRIFRPLVIAAVFSGTAGALKASVCGKINAFAAPWAMWWRVPSG